MYVKLTCFKDSLKLSSLLVLKEKKHDFLCELDSFIYIDLLWCDEFADKSYVQVSYWILS